jgi:hypothetical protein
VLSFRVNLGVLRLNTEPHGAESEPFRQPSVGDSVRPSDDETSVEMRDREQERCAGVLLLVPASPQQRLRSEALLDRAA